MSNNIIYLDNAATTRSKPEEVYNAFNYFIKEIGASPGRGSHFLAIEASRALYKSRKIVAEYFRCPEINNVIFTKNATEASNLFLRGFLNKNDHVLISPFEHNAIFRPIHKLKAEGKITYDIIPVDNESGINEEGIFQLVNSKTRLCIMTLSSNITGKMIFSRRLTKHLKDKGIYILLDTAQGAGRIDIDMIRDQIDFLIFTGHKDLYGLPGTGGLCSLNKLDIDPLLQGGTGVHAETYTNPNILPEKFEAGTLNMPAIWALRAGIEYVTKNKRNIIRKEIALFKVLLEGLKSLPDVILYGDYHLDKGLPIVSFNVKGKDCQEVSHYLSAHKICVRAGLHCNILTHKGMGTGNIGTIRASLDAHNSIEDIERFIVILKEINKG